MIDMRCRRCGEKIPEGQAVRVTRQTGKRIAVETYKSKYETTKWTKTEQDGQMMLCRDCDDMLIRWMNGKLG